MSSIDLQDFPDLFQKNQQSLKNGDDEFSMIQSQITDDQQYLVEQNPQFPELIVVEDQFSEPIKEQHPAIQEGNFSIKDGQVEIRNTSSSGFYQNNELDHDKKMENENPNFKKDKDNTFRKYSRRMEKNLLMKEMGQQHWTKFFLANSKGPHFKYLVNQMGEKWIQNNAVLKRIRNKRGISREDYKEMYRIGDLRQVWRRFFRSQFLYSEVMLGKTTLVQRKVCMKFIYRFKEVFESGEFEYIAGPPRSSNSKNVANINLEQE